MFIRRKFAYKHPTFGKNKNAKASEPYKSSPYYLWWEFLKRNNEYRKCCLKKGAGKFKNLYADFGDIHSADFKQWWQTNERGANLFAEQSSVEFKIVDADSLIKLQKEVLYLQVPLNLPKRYLTQQFQKILNSHHEGKAGIKTNRISTAKYPITGHVDIMALQKCLDVYDMKIANPDMAYWEIAQKCKVARPTQFVTPAELKLRGGAVEKKKVLTTTAERLFRKAEKIISGTALGKFPALS